MLEFDPCRTSPSLLHKYSQIVCSPSNKIADNLAIVLRHLDVGIVPPQRRTTVSAHSALGVGHGIQRTGALSVDGRFRRRYGQRRKDKGAADATAERGANVICRTGRLFLAATLVAIIVAQPDSATAEDGINGIIDTHAHLVPDEAMHFDEALAAAIDVMDRYGIATTFVMSPPSSPAVDRKYDLDDFSAAAKRYPGRFRFMGGGGSLNPIVHGHPDPSSVTPAVREAFAAEARRLIRTGALGFGEMSSLHISLSAKHRFAFVPADHPLLLLLADIAAEENVPIDLHCDTLQTEMATPQRLARFPNNPKRMPATIPALERLLAHNPKARIIWAHAGTDHLGDFTPERIGAMLDRYPNLFLSLKIASPRSQSENKVFSRKKLDSIWHDLLIRHADRFVIGTDSFYGGAGAAGVIVGFTEITEPHQRMTRLFLSKLPPEVARQIGRENARRLYRF